MSQSNTNLSIKKSGSFHNRVSALPTIPLTKVNAYGNRKVTEKGDAGTLGGVKLEILADRLRPISAVRKQYSAPALNRTLYKPSSKPKTIVTRNEGILAEPALLRCTTAPAAVKSSPSADSIEPEPVSEYLLKDPKLNALCTSIGVGSNPNTLIGPIEKGLIIIGTLQDSLNELLKLKMKNAEKNGKKFHIQQSGLDAAVRALENADRSLKTIKEIKGPVFGRARQQRSSDSLTQTHKTTEAVIRILTTVKDKLLAVGETGFSK